MPCHLFCADLGRNRQRGGTWAADGSTTGRSWAHYGSRRCRRSGGRVGSPRRHHGRTRSPSCMRRGHPADRPWRRPGSACFTRHRHRPGESAGWPRRGRAAADLRHAPFHGGPRMVEGTECRHAGPSAMAIGHRLAAVGLAQQIRYPAVPGQDRSAQLPSSGGDRRSRGNCARFVRCLDCWSARPGRVGQGDQDRCGASCHQSSLAVVPAGERGGGHGSRPGGRLDAGDKVTTVDLRVPRNHLG